MVASVSFTRVWLLRLVLPFRFGRLVTGILLLVILAPLFYLGVEEGNPDNTPALFFSAVIAYMIPVISYISTRSAEALMELRPVLDLEEEEFKQALLRMDSFPRRAAAGYLVCGFLAGMAHMSLLSGSVEAMFEELVSNRTALVSTLGAVSVWVVNTAAISLLIQQAVVFSRLGGSAAQISLLHVGRLVPFARVAIAGSLALIGALAMFPLMSVNSEVTLTQILPGAIASSVALLVLFTVPVWPIHRRIAELKKRELASLDHRIDQCLDGGDGTNLSLEQLQVLNPLVGYRREISRVSTWPFDAGSMTRLCLYLVVVPLTWAGAALIENLVDSVL